MDILFSLKRDQRYEKPRSFFHSNYILNTATLFNWSWIWMNMIESIVKRVKRVWNENKWEKKNLNWIHNPTSLVMNSKKRILMIFKKISEADKKLKKN
jgi:hypothetical protein